MDINIQNMVVDLRCPITLDWLEDPICVPCCGKAFSRSSLAQWVRSARTCPACSQTLVIDPMTMTKNTTIESLVTSARANTELRPASTLRHRWSAEYVPIQKGHQTGQLTLELHDSDFKVRNSLFIALVDKSGSMAGAPINQVKAALRHILGMSQNQSNVKTVLVVYDSTSQMIPFTKSAIDGIVGSGGTNFKGAFQSLQQVLALSICSDRPEDLLEPNNVGSVSVAFLTDGQSGGNRDALIRDFREILEDVWISKDRDITIHAIGFSSCCDKDLLEGLRTAGTLEGVFRYAEPSDGDDALCQKITGVYDICSKGSTKTLQVTRHGSTVATEVRIPINERGRGLVTLWCDQSSSSITINSECDQDVLVKVHLNESPILIDRALRKYAATRIDDLAAKLVQLNSGAVPSTDLRDLHCALLRQSIDDLRKWADPNDTERLAFLSNQVTEFSSGKTLNLGQLNDMKFSSLFTRPGPKAESGIKQVQAAVQAQAQCAIDTKPAFERPLKQYSRQNNNTGRNSLQCAIMDQVHDTPLDQPWAMVTDDLLHTDNNGNTALMLASYCGHSNIVKAILTDHADLDGQQTNNDGETAMTLAIKKRGFDKTISVLLDHGVSVPADRKKSLERYAIDNGYRRTAAIIANLGNDTLEMDLSMTEEYIKYIYQRAKVSTEFLRHKDSYLSTILSKGPTALLSLVEDLMLAGVVPTIEHVSEFCMPKKPDAPDTLEYLSLTKLLVKHNPRIIHDVDENGESLLYNAVKRGSLPHVEYFIEQGSKIDQPNKRLATPLHCACYRRYPCIIQSLLDHGADIAWENENGNIPIYEVCVRGPRKVIEQLISHDSPVEHVNRNGDTLVLIAARNGQAEVLECLLEYVSEEYAYQSAHIDDFNAVMAAAEAGHGNCIKVLKEYGMDLEVKTPVPDAKVLGGATALHIAAYYGRVSAIVELLRCGADPNSLSMYGQTPLHIAIIQGYVEAIKVLSDVSDHLVQDDAGNTPMAYCRDRKDIRDLLVNPGLDILMKLSCNGFSKEDTKEALSILRGHKGVFGSSQFVDIRDHNGVTPLLAATLHNNRELAEVLIELGASPNLKDRIGMYPLTWSKHNKNPRLTKLLIEAGAGAAEGTEGTINVDEQLGRLHDAATGTDVSSILFLGTRPGGYHKFEKSPIVQRMIDLQDSTGSSMLPLEYNTSASAIFGAGSGSGSDSGSDIGMEFKELHDSGLIWYAKAFTVAITANGGYLDPKETMAICMYCNNALVSSIINKSMRTQYYSSELVKNYSMLLYETLLKLPPYQGEVFLGIEQVDRTRYTVGQEFTWGQFVSTSTLWRVAMEATPSFTSKSRKGVCFAIKSKSGRLVNQYSQYAFDSEVLLLPYKKYRVYNWYHGDPIALGQPNIREHSFSVDIESSSAMTTSQMMHSDKALIIAVEEFFDDLVSCGSHSDLCN